MTSLAAKEGKFRKNVVSADTLNDINKNNVEYDKESISSNIAGNLSEDSSFIGNGITCLQLSTPQNAAAITLYPYETILD